MDGVLLLLWLVTAAASGYLASTVATSKGHSEQWFLAGLFLGPLGVIAAAGLGDRILQKQMRRIADFNPQAAVMPNAGPVVTDSDADAHVSAARDVTVKSRPEVIFTCIEQAMLAVFGTEYQDLDTRFEALQARCSELASQALQETVVVSREEIMRALRVLAAPNRQAIDLRYGVSGKPKAIRLR